MYDNRTYLESHVDQVAPCLENDGSGNLLHIQMQIKSGLWYPFSFRDNGYYVLVFNQVSFRREWQKSELDFLESVTGQVNIALQKIRFLHELQKSKEAMRISEEKYRALYDNNPSMYFTIDAEGKILSVNKFGAEQLGYKPDELIGKPVLNVFYEEDQPAVSKKLNICLQNPKKTAHWEFRKIRKDGSLVWVKETVRVVKDKSDAPVVFVVCEDITKQKQTEIEKKELEARFQQTQKMESIGTLAGGIAHDFNNLLTVINGHVELALLNISENHPLYRDLKAVESAGQRATNLTRQLLAFSRKQIFEPKIIDINLLISDLDKMLRRLIGEDINIETFLPDDPHRVKADPGQLEQILINLIVNARDAINERTDIASQKKITIETNSTYLDDEYAAGHPEIKSGSYVVLSVSDTGMGMDEEVKNKIFEPFFTTKETGRGTGLGLATVFGIVKQNNGHIDVYSEPGKGTTFKIYWPATDGNASDQQRTKVNSLPLRGNETALIVEDDKAVKEFACRVLNEYGYNTICASNGEQALNLLKETTEKIDLVITDLIMPKMSGKELAEKLISLSPNIKILFASGYTDNHIVHSGVLEEGINFIQKPYSAKALVGKVRQVLDTD